VQIGADGIKDTVMEGEDGAVTVMGTKDGKANR